MPVNPLPLLVLHLGGELVYLLKQRLSAHEVPADQRQGALRQVLLALLDVEFLKSTLQDQHGFADFSVASVKRLIDRFIGASAIRINDQGRDKLFDIIWMVTKFQLANLTFGHEWLAVLENHLDNALVICANGPPSTDQILLERMQMVDQIVLGHFRKLSVWEMDQCKYSIWTYMLQKQARVSLLVQGLYQDPDSGQLRFTFKQHQLPPGFMAPGQIQYGNTTVSYPALEPIKKYYPRSYTQSSRVGQRGTHLGHDIFNIQFSKPLPQPDTKTNDQTSKPLPKKPEPRMSTIQEVLDLKRALLPTGAAPLVHETTYLFPSMHPLSQEETDRLLDFPIDFASAPLEITQPKTAVKHKELGLDTSISAPDNNNNNQALDGDDLLSLMDS